MITFLLKNLPPFYNMMKSREVSQSKAAIPTIALVY